MYLEYYGLREPPFSITPDPRFVFLSERHRDALAHLLFGIGQGGGGGFVQLTGEVGTGKTTVSRLLLEQLPDHARVALVLNPRLSPIELLETICEELHLDLDGRRGSVKQLVDLLNRYLLDAYAQGLRVVLIIDEAQNLSVDALEQVRLLTNLETDTQKLLQIILLGQPELRTMLAREDLRQLAQRITARFHLTPLDASETEAYLRHRYKIAGGQRFPFTAAGIKCIHVHARGVPRLINVIAERALLGGYAHDESMIGARVIDRAAREALAPTRRPSRHVPMAMAAAVAALAVATAFWLWPRKQDAAAAPASMRAAAAPTDDSAKASPGSHGASANPFGAKTPRARRVDEAALRTAIAQAGATPTLPWRNLLQAWQLPVSDADATTAAACAPAITRDVRCLRGTARLDKLTAQGRPVLLRLHDARGDAWALLLGADAVDARLRVGSDVLDIDRLTLERVWSGEYAALWRAPDYVRAPLAAGQYGPAVDWVHERLRPRYPGPAVMDTALSIAIRRFQTDQGLVTDGVIGPETLMALSARDDGPRLLRVLE